MNILYLHSHDTGRVLATYGYPVATPNLDAFAESAVVFRSAHSAAPTSSPSRAALLTGLSPHRNGMLGLAQRGFRLIDYSRHIVAVLGQAGYHTVLSGVQHEAESWATIGYHQYLADPTDAHVAAAEFLAGYGGAPFFLSVGLAETHRQFPLPLDQGSAERARPLPPLPDTPQTRVDMARFSASVAEMDRKMGHVLQALQESKHASNTLVILTTDHGPPFPGMKCTLTGSGTGVMLMLSGPGREFNHRTIDSLVSHLDIVPTLHDLLGIPAPADLEGVSLMPLLRSEVSAIRDSVTSEVSFHAAYEPMRAIRTERYAYMRRFDGRVRPVVVNCDDSESKQFLLSEGWGGRSPAHEGLFDLLYDPFECNNLVDDPRSRDILDDLRVRLRLWMEATRDPLLLGFVAPPNGAVLNDPDAQSAGADKFTVA